MVSVCVFVRSCVCCVGVSLFVCVCLFVWLVVHVSVCVRVCLFGCLRVRVFLSAFVRSCDPVWLYA